MYTKEFYQKNKGRRKGSRMQKHNNKMNSKRMTPLKSSIKTYNLTYHTTTLNKKKNSKTLQYGTFTYESIWSWPNMNQSLTIDHQIFHPSTRKRYKQSANETSYSYNWCRKKEPTRKSRNKITTRHPSYTKAHRGIIRQKFYIPILLILKIDFDI